MIIIGRLDFFSNFSNKENFLFIFCAKSNKQHIYSKSLLFEKKTENLRVALNENLRVALNVITGEWEYTTVNGASMQFPTLEQAVRHASQLLSFHTICPNSPYLKFFQANSSSIQSKTSYISLNLPS